MSKQAAYVISQSVCALIKAMGMHAENIQRQSRGEGIAYVEDHFNALNDEHGLHHNDVLTSLEE